jgi:5'-nucleotidase
VEDFVTFERSSFRLRPSSRVAQGGLVAVSLSAVLLAPLAATGPAVTAAPTISGAQTLTDTVSVSFQSAAETGQTSTMHVLAWNDFHGNLEPAALNIYGKFAGGAPYLAKLVKDRQAIYGRRAATVLAGDNIGASPLASALVNEEPSTVVSNLMNVDFSSVGNHEFDKGAAELLRIQNGGCKPVTGCTGAPYAKESGGTTKRYPGADFQYLAANVVDTATNAPIFPAFGTKKMRTSSNKDVTVGFIGEVLKDTPSIVTPSGVAGLSFIDEATAANKAVKDLAAQGVKIPVLVIHQGGAQSGTAALNGCAGSLAGSDIAKIAEKLDPAIKIIVSGHTHNEYRCTITTNGVTRLITSAASFGRILTDLTLTVNDDTGELAGVEATNTIVENALNTPGTGVVRVPDPSKADPKVQAVVDQYVTASAPLANKVVGRASGDLTRTATGESTLGDVIADAQLASTSSATTGNAVIAFMNPGGIRADLLTSAISSGGEAPGQITYGEAFTVQPFGNSLVTKTMTGAQIRSLLQQQFAGCGGQTVNRTLQISATLKYEKSTTALPASPTAADCAAQIGVISINGVAINPATSYRVTMNNFLASGGDGFTAFNGGTDVLGGAQDIDSFVSYLTAAEPTGISVPALNRIVPKP